MYSVIKYQDLEFMIKTLISALTAAYKSFEWWRWQESNLRPPECKSGALPAELHPRISKKMVAGTGFEPATFGLWAQRATGLLHPAISFYFFEISNLKFQITRLGQWWAWVDSNYRPHAYQACALTNWATGPRGLSRSCRPVKALPKASLFKSNY